MGEEDVVNKFKSAESYGSSEDVVDKEKQFKEKKNKRAMFVAGGLAIAITAGASFFLLDGDDAVKEMFSASDDRSSSRILGNNSTVNGGDNRGENVKEEDDSDIAAEIPEWSTVGIDFARDNGDLRREIFATYYNTGIRANTYAMSSESNGYHTRGTLDDKSVSYTLEEYIAANGEYIQRLINPTFGGWSEYQYANGNAAEEFPVEIFDDMFSEDYKERYQGAPPASYLPVYADWESNNYDMNNLSNAARWHGEVKNLTSNIEDYGGINERTEITADIVFSAWTEQGKKVEKEATLQLEVIPGSSDERPLVINEAILNVK